MSKRPKDADTSTAAELARTLDLSEASIHGLARRGVVVRASRGKYLREESVRRYVRELRAQLEAVKGGADSAATLRAEKIRVTKAQADAVEIKNAQKRGELLQADEVERTWSDTLRSLSTGLLTIPAQCGAKLPHLTQQDVLAIDVEIRARLVELGEGNGDRNR